MRELFGDLHAGALRPDAHAAAPEGNVPRPLEDGQQACQPAGADSRQWCPPRNFKGSKRMGLQLWWASEGVHTRTEACREGNRCGVYASKDKLDTGKAPKCAHHRTPCTCDECAAAATALATRTAGATAGQSN